MNIALMIDMKEYAKKPQGQEVGAIQNRLKATTTTPEGLIDYIGKGCSFKPALLSGKGNNDWLSQQVIAVDFDNRANIDEELNRCSKLKKDPYFAYTTFSHTAEHHKFRLVFILDEPIKDKQEATDILKLFKATFPNADRSKFALSSLFFGGHIYRQGKNVLVKKSMITGRKEYTQQHIKADRPCIDAMLQGVPEGERNFSLGRITKWLQLKGFTKDKAKNIILDWNTRNRPAEQKEKLLQDFNAYWHGDYKLLGCVQNKGESQQVLYKYCKRPECDFTRAIGHIKTDNHIKCNNRLLKNLNKITGNDIIIYGLLQRHKEGLTTSLLFEKLCSGAKNKPCMIDRTFRACIDRLEKQGFVETIKGNRRAGKEYLYKIIPQGTYGLGYTLISNGAINGAIDKRIKPAQLKLYVLLLKYAFSKGSCYPSLDTLAKDLRIQPENISTYLKTLEKKDYIKRNYMIFDGVEKLNITLLV